MGVTHYHRYCEIDVNGQVEVVRSFGGNTAGGGDGQLHEPCCFTVDQRGNVFIADSSNNRILVLDSTTFTAKSLSIDVDVALQYPYSVHWDNSREVRPCDFMLENEMVVV